MSPSLNLSLLALVSAAAAVPQYSAHSRFHSKHAGHAHGTGHSGHAYPTGGWGGSHNKTRIHPTGTGRKHHTTTVLSEHSVETIVSTIYASPVPAGASGVAGAQDYSSAAGCGPATITVTATNKVTVTVPAGGAAPSSYGGVSTPLAVSSAISAGFSGPAVSEYSVTAYSSAPAVPVSFSYPVSPSAITPIASVPKPSSVPAYTPPVKPSTPAAVSSVPAYTPSEKPTPSPQPSKVVPSYSAAAPSSSAAPKSSSVPSYGGSKRGLAYNTPDLCSSFDTGKFSWAYNWGATQYGGSLPKGVTFYPTLHKPTDASAEQWAADVKTAHSAGAKVIFGYNEPDIASQGNLSPSAACDQWKTQMNPIASAYPDITIVGPSVSNAQAPQGLGWLQTFAETCPDATWHAANIHFYDQYDSGTVGRFTAQIEKAAQQTGKKVWVTEFGLNPGATDQQAADFLKGCMDYMESSDKVSGYSYFMVGSGPMQLNSGNGLSAVGQVYNS